MLVGRRDETAAIERLLSDARQGRSGVLVLRGEAGVGKSTLLGYALDQAEAMTVLRGRGFESEAELAFAGLHQLFRPALHLVEGLPAPQAAALRSAFALSGETVDNRFRVAVGVLAMLGELAERQPVLCVVDDAQWLDRPSAESLVFAARRLGAEAVAMLIAVRDGSGQGLPAHGLSELSIAKLSDVDARALANARLGNGAALEAVDWLVENAQGNPLALIELSAAAADHSAAAVAPTTSVEQAYLQRILSLPDATRRLLVLAAAEEAGDRAVLARAAGMLGLDMADLVPAQQAGLVSVTVNAVEFRHPLVRSATYRSASFTEREAVHVALAAALDRDVDVDRRAWHRAAATVGANEGVAAELEESAQRASQRGGHATAAAALIRAAQLTPDDAQRGRRLGLAGAASGLAGQHERAVSLIARATSLQPSPVQRADLAFLRGGFELWHGRPAATSDMLAGAAEEVRPHDATRALKLAVSATEAGAIAGDVERMARATRVVANTPLPDPADEQLVLLSLLPRGGELLFRGDIARSAPIFERAVTLTAGEDPREMKFGAIAAALAGDYVEAQRRYDAAVLKARETGAVGTLWFLLSAQAMSNLYFAQLREAAEAAHEATRLAADFGAEEQSIHAVSVLSWVAAIEGDEEQHRFWSERVEPHSSRGVALAPAIIAWGRAELALARGRWEDALVDLSAICSFRPGFGHPLLSVACVPSLVEAAVRSGQQHKAAAGIDQLEQWVQHGTPHHRRPLLERVRALTASTPAEATAHFTEALRLFDQGGSDYERARTGLLLGEHLRRQRQRSDSREHLRNAQRGFDALGATPWAQRAAGELRAAGETVRAERGSPGLRLTPQEQQIARLASQGSANKEIAAQLFLSHRTVEYHLRKIFMKLGIASRAELIRQRVDESPSPVA